MSQSPPPPSGSQPSEHSESEPTSDDRTWAMIAQVGGIVVGFLAGLIVMLTKGKESDFVRRHAVEALNFQITVAIAYIVSLILTIVVIGLLLLPIVFIGSLVLMIMAGIAANNGQEYRYPINIRIVK